MRWWVLFLPVLAFAGNADFRIERSPVAGGAELLTVFGRLPDAQAEASAEVPLVSVLRDTLGDSDPENDRLRYVWVLSSARPSLLQRATALVPFYYWRADFGKNADRQPVPVIDLGDTSRRVWTSLASSLTQVMALDPNGALIRSSTRAYQNNALDHDRMRLLEGLAILSQLEDLPEGRALLSEPELLEIEARLTLAGKTLGGLVSEDNLPDAYIKQRTRSAEARGHNWELLRQRAEANGLYFQPLGLNGSSTHALLWIAREDLGNHPFDSQFLGIADPYKDPRLRNWTGYHSIRDGRDMIPLALYGLDYPKVPLLLVDFRNTHSPKRREMIRRAAAETVTGVLGISKWGNWPYMAGSWAFNFVRTRHGAATNREARLKVYSQVRQWLALDHSLDENLRNDLLKRLENLGVNPLEDSVFDEVKIAQRQYAALLRYAQDPNGLAKRVEQDRRSELRSYAHGFPARAGLRLAQIATLGVYEHHEKDESILEARLDEERRVARQLRFLETVAESSAQPEVVWNMDEVRRALDEVTASRVPARSAQLVRRILAKTNDEETRALCQRALESLGTAVGQ
jgi:hypothetical protein